MAKRGGRRSQNKPAKAARTGDDAEPDHRHKADIVKSLTATLEAVAEEAGVTEQQIISRATKHLHENCEAAQKVAPQTVGRYLKKLRETGTTADKPHTGRPPKLTAAQLDAALRHFEDGFYVAPEDHSCPKQWFGFTSPEHAFLECCPNSDKLRAMLRNSGLTVRGFWEAMCRHKGHRGFNKIHIYYGKRLPDDVKDERVSISQDWADWEEERLDHTVFIDEKPLWLNGANDLVCYAPDGTGDIIREGLLMVRESYKVKFLSAVNALLGGFSIEQVSGSAAMETQWTVRT